MTIEELAELERREFEDSLRELMGSQAFRRVFVSWLAQARAARPEGPVTEAALPHLNWAAAQAAMILGLEREIERLHPPTAVELQQETMEYVQRRTNARDADERDR